MNESRSTALPPSTAVLTRYPWIMQILRFGGVGVGATLVHVIGFVGLVELLSVGAVLANVLAFSIAVLVSFVGHACWTFRDEYRRSGHTVHWLFARFVVSAVLGLLLNTLFVFVLVTWLGLAYGWAVPCFVLITPLVLYLANRLWVFK